MQFLQCQFFNNPEAIGEIENCMGEQNIEVKILRGEKYEAIQQSVEGKRRVFDQMQEFQNSNAIAQIILQQQENLADLLPTWDSEKITIQYILDTDDPTQSQNSDDQERQETQNPKKYVTQDIRFYQDCVTTSIKNREINHGQDNMQLEITLKKSKFMSAMKRVTQFNKLVGNNFRSLINFDENMFVIASFRTQNQDQNQKISINEYFICILTNIDE